VIDHMGSVDVAYDVSGLIHGSTLECVVGGL
jgi:hypothetical protein